MSHATVLVIGNNVDEKMAPYDENLEVDRYISDTKENIIKNGKKSIIDFREGAYKEYLSDPVKYENECKNKSHIDYIKNEFPKKLKWTDEQIYQDEIKYYEPEDISENGDIYSTSNPKSKWDWWLIGGRWTNSFKLKDGADGIKGEPSLIMLAAGQNNNKPGYCDQAKKGDIDWDFMKNDKEEIDRLSKLWDEIIAGKTFNRPEYYIEKYGDKDNFIKISMEFSTFAVITDDGVWHEAGQLGWFGIDNALPKARAEFQKSFFDTFVKDLPDDTLLTVIDYHI